VRRPGDDKDSYDVRIGQMERRQDLGVKAAAATESH